ncbi:MAG: hypothetical protein R3284_10440, partial [Rubricoccaceae bacterium]|nr:hypothetical protein [Rubricoccaceae bacterium]
MRYLYRFVFLVSLISLAGCASNRELTDDQDTLRAENATLRADLEAAYELLERTRSAYQESQARVEEL